MSGSDHAPSPTPPQARIDEITPAEARLRQVRGALLIDVREDVERVAGSPTEAVAVPRAHLREWIGRHASDRDRDILLLCGSGVRSRVAADTLLAMGYRRVASIAGGYARWQREGLPVERPAGMDPDDVERYARQLRLPQVGVEGQKRLGAAKVLIVGAGGLGSPAALYLAGAGIGRMTVIDDDRVERSNLHRQVVHADARVGMPKAASAAMTLQALNPRVHVEAQAERLQASNVERVLAGHDLVVDGADNFAARHLLAAASVRLKMPMIYGAVERFAGQVSVFDPRRADSPCYRCLYPHAPDGADAPNCAEAGVLGILPGIIGLLQATEAIKLILGLGDSLVGRLLTFDALAMRFGEWKLARDPTCPGCGTNVVFGGYEDVVRACASTGRESA